MTLDISRLGELSACGLLADKVLLELDKLKSGREVNRAMFSRASEFWARAIDGQQGVDRLEVSQDTAFAINTYATASRALPENEAEGAEDVSSLLQELKEVCEQLSSGATVEAPQVEILAEVFTGLSDYTLTESKTILQEATGRLSHGVFAHAH